MFVGKIRTMPVSPQQSALIQRSCSAIIFAALHGSFSCWTIANNLLEVVLLVLFSLYSFRQNGGMEGGWRDWVPGATR